MSNLIDRQAAIDALVEEKGIINGILDSLMLGSESRKKWEQIRGRLLDDIEIIAQLPSAQPETAKRIVGKSRDGMTLWYQCDMCNEPVDAQDNFCRGCGRRLTDG